MFFVSFPPWCRSLWRLALGLLLTGGLRAETALPRPVVFSVTADMGFGNEVFVTGDAPELGQWDLARAPKLTYTAGNAWTAQVALEANATVQCKFVRRSGLRANWCDTSGTIDLSAVQTFVAPAGPSAPFRGKTIFYRSAWTRAFLVYRNNGLIGGTFRDIEMRAAGPGRVAGETLFRVELPGETPAAELEWVFHNQFNQYDNAPAPPSSPPQGAAPGVPAPYQGLAAPYNYRSSLPWLLVQDGQVFSYDPPAAVSAPRIETRFVNSTAPGIAGRTVRVSLPRGYDANAAHRYPVVVFHDGQNMYFPGGAFGTWDADRIAAYETAQGRMREAILVSVDNDGNERIREYTPPTDVVVTSPSQTGAGDQYAAFLLSNVLPMVRANYRTRTLSSGGSDPAQTIVAGSSLGGLVSTYLALEWPDTFGRAGVLSPAFWAAPNYASVRDAAPKRALRWFLSIGTAETSSGANADVYWNDAQRALNAWLADGYAHGTELTFRAGCGQGHNEFAWSLLLPSFFAFHLPAGEEPNALALRESPGVARVADIHPIQGNATLEIITLRGAAAALERASSLAPGGGGWSTVGALSPVTDAWGVQTVEDASVPALPGRAFWRLRLP